MANYSLVKLPKEPIVILTPHADHDVIQDGPEAADQTIRLIEAQSTPVGLILDLTHLKMDFSEIMSGSSMVARGPSALFHHPNVKIIATVSQDTTIELVNEGLSDELYGHLLVITVDSLDKALAYLRAQLT